MSKVFKIAVLASLIVLSVVSLTFFPPLSQQPRTFKVRIPSSRGGDGGEYVATILNCSLPEVPKEMPIIEVVRRNYTEAEAIAIARNLFNMGGELKVTPFPTDNPRGLQVASDTHYLILYYTGAVVYLIKSSANVYHPHLPQFSEAKEIADEFLQKVNEFGLIPKSLSILFSRVNFCEWCGTPPQPPEPVAIGVGYKVEWNGTPLIRKGGIGVEIGDNGEIVTFHGYWRDVKTGISVPVISPEQALENMGQHIGIRNIAKIQGLVINRVELGYDTPPPMMQVDELLPAYEIEALATFEDGSEEELWIYVPATST